LALLRFISWKANHDIGHAGLDLTSKKELVERFLEVASKYSFHPNLKRLIPVLKKYLITIPPHLIHHAMAHAALLITEGPQWHQNVPCLGRLQFM